MATKDCVNKEKLPLHVAIIMDGNGRWAQAQGNQRIFGHQNGVVAVRQTVEAAAELGIQYLTLYAFSTENWNRPREEIEALMLLLVQTIKNELDTLNKNNVRLHAIGDMESLPDAVRSEMEAAIGNTQKNNGLNLILALSYSSRWEILDAMRRIAADIKNNQLPEAQITCDVFTEYLHTSKFPDPELLIRTSGEYRLSNFLLWQLAYTELYFTDILWPDFRKENFYDAIVDFQKRERRFGKISAQVEDKSLQS